MSIRNFFIIALIGSVSMVSGCKSLWGGDPPVATQPAAPPEPVVVNGMRVSYADVVERTSPAVVRIEAEHKEKVSQQQFPFGDDFFHQFGVPQQNTRPQIAHGLGSGVIVEANGTILTNYHVVEGA